MQVTNGFILYWRINISKLIDSDVFCSTNIWYGLKEKNVKISNLTTSITITRHFADIFLNFVSQSIDFFPSWCHNKTIFRKQLLKDKKYRKCLIPHDVSNKLHDINDHLETQKWHFHLNFVACLNGFTHFISCNLKTFLFLLWDRMTTFLFKLCCIL